MIKKEKYIEFIISELRKGNVSFNNVFKLIQTDSNLKCVRSTFSNYWKIANETYKNELDKANLIKEKEYLESAKKQAKKGILTKEEVLEILSNIALGKERNHETDSGKETIIPSDSERVRAIDQMAKIEGWNAPIKSEDVTQKAMTKEEIKQELKDMGIDID